MEAVVPKNALAGVLDASARSRRTLRPEVQPASVQKPDMVVGVQKGQVVGPKPREAQYEVGIAVQAEDGEDGLLGEADKFQEDCHGPVRGGGLAVRLTHSERAAPRGARPHGAQLLGLLRADKAVRCPGVEEAFDPTASQRVWRSIRGCGGARRCSPSRLRRR